MAEDGDPSRSLGRASMRSFRSRVGRALHGHDDYLHRERRPWPVLLPARSVRTASLRATMAATSAAPGIDDLAYALPPDVVLLGQRGRQTDVRRGTDLVCHALAEHDAEGLMGRGLWIGQRGSAS